MTHAPDLRANSASATIGAATKTPHRIYIRIDPEAIFMPVSGSTFIIQNSETGACNPWLDLTI